MVPLRRPRLRTRRLLPTPDDRREIRVLVRRRPGEASLPQWRQRTDRRHRASRRTGGRGRDRAGEALAVSPQRPARARLRYRRGLHVGRPVRSGVAGRLRVDGRADAGHRLAANDTLYTDHGELRYSLDPWSATLRSGRTSTWSRPDNARRGCSKRHADVVDHRDILDERDLPTFNSHAIARSTASMISPSTTSTSTTMSSFFAPRMRRPPSSQRVVALLPRRRGPTRRPGPLDRCTGRCRGQERT